MSTKKKQTIKWTAGVGSVVASIAGVATPLIIKQTKDEEELHKDAKIINDLNTKILNQANHTQGIVDDVRKTLTLIYKDIGELNGKIQGIEHAVNIALRVRGE